MKKRTNQYDETKRMLNLLRNINESTAFSKRAITEQTTPAEPAEPKKDEKNSLDDVMVINDVEVTVVSKDKDDMKFEEDDKTAISGLIDNFKSQVSQIVEFEPGITIDEKQIRLDGQLTDNEIGFVYIAGVDGGLYVNLDMVEITPEILPLFDKLNKFTETYKTTMEPLVSKLTNN